MEKLWFNLTTIFLSFGNLLSKNLVIGVLKGAHTLLKVVLEECHSFSNAGVGAGVLLKISSEWEWDCHSKNKGVLNPLAIGNK